MGREETLIFRCDSCDDWTGHVDNDIPEDESDTRAPSDWSQILLRRAWPNPDYGKAPDGKSEDVLTQMLSGVPEEQREQAEAMWGPMLQQAAIAVDEEPKFIIDEIEVWLCQKCLPRILGHKDAIPDPLLNAGWIASVPQVKVAEGGD